MENLALTRGPLISDAAQLLLGPPQLFLRDMDLRANRAIFARMDRAGYLASSFLDSRAVVQAGPDIATPLASLLRLNAALRPRRRKAYFLFHTGHCGSTLLSRVLAQGAGLLPLREPPPVLDLAQMLRFFGTPRMSLNLAQWQELFDLALVLMTRTYGDHETVLVKPTSDANNLLPRLMAWHPDCRALLMYVDLPTHLATMRKKDNRPDARHALVESRIQDYLRLTSDHALQADHFSDGQAAALVWILQLHEYVSAIAISELAGKLLPVHFDDFLCDPAAEFARIAAFFELDLPKGFVDQLAHSEVMASYAKSPLHRFTQAQRDADLRRSRQEHAAEIAAALIWARALVAAWPILGVTPDMLDARWRIG